MIMETEFRIRSGEEFIKLGQLMKACGFSDSGVEAKIEIINGNVKVNGETETRRGRKIKEGDSVSFAGKTVKIIR